MFVTEPFWPLSYWVRTRKGGPPPRPPLPEDEGPGKAYALGTDGDSWGVWLLPGPDPIIWGRCLDGAHGAMLADAAFWTIVERQN